jgi:hypothetical protein
MTGRREIDGEKGADAGIDIGHEKVEPVERTQASFVFQICHYARFAQRTVKAKTEWPAFQSLFSTR